MIAILILLFILTVFVWTFVNPPARRIFNDHVHFMHGPLGAAKTCLAATFASDVLVSASKKQTGETVFTTFVCEGTIPLDLTLKVWPRVKGAKIIIDEYLLLESNDLVPMEWLSFGCTLARQLEQQVIIISQASRLASRHRKFIGTIGTFITMKSFPIGKLGRVVIVKKAAEPYVRRSKGYKADGQRILIKWVPRRIFASYQSRKIYGYTCDPYGNWLHSADEKLDQLEAYKQLLYAEREHGLLLDPGGAAHVTPERSEGGAAHETHISVKKKRSHRVRRVA